MTLFDALGVKATCRERRKHVKTFSFVRLDSFALLRHFCRLSQRRREKKKTGVTAISCAQRAAFLWVNSVLFLEIRGKIASLLGR